MRELIEALLRDQVASIGDARLIEAELIEAGAKHARLDLTRLREILRLVRLVIGPYSEEEKAEAKAELDQLAAEAGAPAPEGESMVERAARAAIAKAQAVSPPDGEPVPASTEPAPAAASASPPDGGESKPKAEAKAKAAAEKATGRKVTVTIAEAVDPDQVSLIESVEPSGKVWDVLAIRAGTSINGKRYRPEVLREAVDRGTFEGARSFADLLQDHGLIAPGVSTARRTSIRSLVGWHDNARYVESIDLPGGKGKATGVVTRYHVIDPAMRITLAEAWESGRPDIIGFSIYGDGPTRVVKSGRTHLLDVERIDKIESIDPVANPSAGGQALRLVASVESQVDPCSKCGSTVEGHTCSTAPDVSKIVEAAVASAMAPITSTRLIEAALIEFPNLPEKAKARVRAATVASAEEAKKLIESEAEYVAAFAPAHVSGAGPAKVTSDQRDKLVESLSDVLEGKAHSIRKVYIDLTGDDGMTGKLQTSGRLVESGLIESAIISTTFAKLTAEVFNKRLMAEYRLPGLDDWRKIVSATPPANDFRDGKIVMVGGYANLPVVAEAGPYTALAEAAEADVTQPKVVKYGGTEDLTLEAIANDDVRAFRRIPANMARAAKRTLRKGVWDVLATNATYGDGGGLALFHASHGGNLGATALSEATIKAARQVMLKQADLAQGSERLGIAPRFLCYPVDLDDTVQTILGTDKVLGSGNNDLNVIRRYGLEPVMVDYWTDANNWFLVADPAQYDTIEVRFFQGREDPEMFLQDEPTVGDNFAKDALTYKIRHIWAITLVDYRPFYGAIVA
jgi:hypothetical protein